MRSHFAVSVVAIAAAAVGFGVVVQCSKADRAPIAAQAQAASGFEESEPATEKDKGKESAGKTDGVTRSHALAATPTSIAGLASGRMVDDVASASPIRAGEWDDNANYREFQHYLAGITSPIHSVDVRARRFLIVRDTAGKAVSRCPVTVSDDAQHQVTLTTTASGRAILFPYAEGLTGKHFSASAACVEGSAKGTVALDDDGDGTVDLRINGVRRNDARVVDLAFILDTTGSMSEEITSVRSTIQKVAQTLQSNQLQVRIGMIEYKDRTDPFVTKTYAFTTDLGAFSAKISGVEASGGGDLPEDMNAGIHAGLTDLAWNPQAVARMAFIIADAPPHLDYANDPDYAVSMKTASHRGIQLFGVAASGMNDLGQAVLRQMAEYTGATEMFVLRGGAGPQSVGGGDPISSCGGKQEQYASGNLDGLIISKIKRELAALDADPTRIAGLRTDESAKPCNERFALAF